MLESAIRYGARQAERGEFSRRAFVNGRMDRSRMAVAELITSALARLLLRLRRLDGCSGRRTGSNCATGWKYRTQMCLAVDFLDEEWKAWIPLPCVGCLDSGLPEAGVCLSAVPGAQQGGAR